jgi:hypothetical protein
MNVSRKYGAGAELVWKDRKRWLGMPLSFTRYVLVRKPGSWFKLFLDIGFLSTHLDEVNLYRICDIGFHQGLLGKMLNVGDVTLYTSDESMPTVVLKNIKNPHRVRDMFSTYMEEQRKANNIRMAEFHDHEG